MTLQELCAEVCKRADLLEKSREVALDREAATRRQLDDALDGIHELKMKVKALEQLNEELRSLPVARAR
jgi:hypothetical protein